MKTTKFFLMAALALTFAACSNDDNDILNPAQTAKGEGITITATLAPKDAGATTRAVSEGTNEIEVTWAKNEHIAILYDKDGAQMADAEIKSVDASGTATIEFSVVDGTADNTACTLVYPYSAAKDDKSGVKDAATLLAAQNGTLNANLDVRVGAGKIKTSTPGLDVTTQPAAQFAIFKFTVKNSGASATIDVKPLTITIGSQDYVITPSAATSELFAALPAVSGQTVSFSATGSDSKTYVFFKDGVTFTAGNYYQSTLKMAAPTNLSSISGSEYTVQNGEVLTGALAADATTNIKIADNATVLLKDVTINGTNVNDDAHKHAGITSGNNSIIILEGTNTVKGFYEYYPGISVPSGKTLTIQGTGSLTASSNGWAAGIGGGYQIACGNIVISGGNITATGGTYSAGIGGGYDASCGNINISGGTVTATGGNNAAGIGGGYRNGTCGTINITSGVTSVTATKGMGVPMSIGKGKNGTAISVTIDGVANATTSSTFPNFNSSVSGNTWTLTHK